jgi:hypothetical protein
MMQIPTSGSVLGSLASRLFLDDLHFLRMQISHPVFSNTVFQIFRAIPTCAATQLIAI